MLAPRRRPGILDGGVKPSLIITPPENSNMSITSSFTDAILIVQAFACQGSQGQIGSIRE